MCTQLFDAMDGYTSKARAEQLMVGLGFKENEFNKSLKDFSGGDHNVFRMTLFLLNGF